MSHDKQVIDIDDQPDFMFDEYPDFEDFNEFNDGSFEKEFLSDSQNSWVRWFTGTVDQK